MSAATAGPPGTEPPAETIDSDRLLDRINFHPFYTTNYSVNRSSRAWGQTVDIARKVGPLSFGNNWMVTTAKDPNRSDLRQKHGSMTLNLDYSVPSHGSWTIGLDGSFRRDSQFSSFRDVTDNNSDYGMEIKTGLPEQLMQRLVSPLREFGLKTDAKLGYNRGDNVSRRSIRNATLLDSTQTGGFFQRYNAGLGGTLLNLNLELNAASDRTAGDSRTSQIETESGERRPLIEDATELASERWEGSVGWKPLESLEARASSRWVDELSQYWDIQANEQQGGQESKQGKNRTRRFAFRWNPSTENDFRAEYTRSWLEGNYELQENLDFSKKRKVGKVTGKFVLPEVVGPAAGTKFDVSYSDEESDNDLALTDYLQTNRSLRLSALRKLGRKLQLQFTEEVQLQQYFYADTSNDRDDRRFFTDGNLTYSPNGKFSGVFSVSWSQREAISIPEARAANNNTRQSYKIDTDLTYTRGLTSINQRYTIQADYTFYDFNEDNNVLVRTNSVNTTFRGPVASGTTVAAKHQYQHRDSGSYVRETENGVRTYAASSEETRHALTLKATYLIAGVLTINAEQLFDQRQSRRVTSDRLNTTLRTEFSLNVNLVKKISADFVVKMNFRKTQSSSEKDYWTGRASIERRF